MDDGTEPIADDELLYRRIPAVWYDALSGKLNSEAFRPHKQRDVTGLSVSRAKYKHIDEAALGRPGKTYFVAVLIAEEVRNAGMDIESRPNTPEGFDPAHAEVPDLNAANYKDAITLERQRKLVELCRSIEGPFETPPE